MNPRRRADTSRSQTRAPTASVVRLTTIATIVLALGASLASGQPVTPSPCPFTVVVTATPSTGASPLVVQLNATVTSGTPTQFDWSFGDGSYWNSSGAGSAAPLHRYAAPGPYQAKVSVVEASCQATGSVTVVTTPNPISVSLSASPVGGPAPLTVQFSALISGGTATYASAFWSFGDGGVGSGVAVAYTYQRAGSFHVEVNITDSGGHWALASSVVTVRPASAVGPVKLFGIDAWVLEAGVAATIGIAVVAAILRTRARRVAERRSPRAAPTLADPGVAGMPPRTLAPPPPIPEAATAVGGPEEFSANSAAVSDRPSGGASARGRGEARVQLTQRVILHIGAQGRLAADDIGPVALTQAGMADRLEVGQNSLTNVLRRLVAAGVLQQDVRHVSGRPRRLRVYRFTERGESVYRDVRSRSLFETQTPPPTWRAAPPPQED